MAPVPRLAPRPPLQPASDTLNAGGVVPTAVREAVDVAIAEGLPVPPELRIIEAAAQNDVAEVARIVQQGSMRACSSSISGRWWWWYGGWGRCFWMCA